MAVTATTTASSYITQTRRHMTPRFLLIWLDSSIDQENQVRQTILAQLNGVVDNVNIFTERDDCIDFLVGVNTMKTFLIVADAMAEQMLPLVHDIPQLDTVYIFL